MNNYQCKRCETLIQNSSTPGGICPSGGGAHDWCDLGKVGNNNYQCRRCSTLVKSDYTPAGICPSGGGAHDWNKI